MRKNKIKWVPKNKKGVPVPKEKEKKWVPKKKGCQKKKTVGDKKHTFQRECKKNRCIAMKQHDQNL